MEQANPRDIILQTLSEKACTKLEIQKITKEIFGQFKKTLEEIADDLRHKMAKVDDCIVVDYRDNGEYEAEFRFADDVLIFHLNLDVYNFDKSHGIWKSSYVSEENQNTYCGMINVYNFLTNSIHYNRVNDIGYMVARIFINREKHFFVEGKRQLGFLYNDFPHAVIDERAITSIIESAILYCLGFDLLTPPYDQVTEVRVSQVNEISSIAPVKTGKRLGFRFQADDDSVE